MKTQLLLLLLSLLLPALSYETEQPRLTSIASEIEPQPEQADPLQSEGPSHGRQLLTITRNAIRITLDSSPFNTVTAGPSGSTTSTNLAFILRAMQVAKSFF
jgi:hypothetical protein